jgi:YfiH family protein
MPRPSELSIAISPSPEYRDGVPSWEFAHGDFRVRFLGAGAGGDAASRSVAFRLAPGAESAAWLRQCHSAKVLDAEPGGERGEGDALVVATPRLAAVVATADCVPVAVVGARAGAVVHAGWKGIVAGVVPRALERLRAAGEDELTAWIGPAIGGCCYEVGPDVAAAVMAASGPDALVAEELPVAEGGSALPRLDLRRAVASQLVSAGVALPTLVDVCTRCHPELLWSHRRDRERAGRNLALLWRVA